MIKDPTKQHAPLNTQNVMQHTSYNTYTYSKLVPRWQSQADKLVELKIGNPSLRIRSAEQLGPAVYLSFASCVCDKCVCGVCVAYCSIKGSLLWRRRRPNGSSRLCHFLQSLPCTFARPIHSQSNLISTTKRLMESPSHVSLALQVIALQETIYHYFPCVNISISSI